MSRNFFSFVAISALCGTLFGAPKNPPAPPTPYFQGDIMEEMSSVPAYNAPAKIDLKNRSCEYFIDASFIYWYASQDGMTLATSGDLATTSALLFNNQSTALIQSFDYKPGFKVGIGTGGKEWELHAEYTWVRQKTSVNSNAPTDHKGPGSRTPVWVVSDWFAQSVGSLIEPVTATNLTSSWHLGIDMLDLTAGRPYYQGRSLTISPYGGLRGTRIRQSLLIGATVPSVALDNATLAAQPIHSHNRSNSWGVGAVFGASSHCLLGSGFRVQGDGNFSILFTRYTKLYHAEDSVALDSNPAVFKILTENYNTVRPMANVALGLGWGKYLRGGSYHLDFSADYEFNVLWDQNMMRRTVQELTAGSSPSNDLFLHGVTVTGRMDF